jgi:PPOX class probable F420-dependent enzyme
LTGAPDPSHLDELAAQPILVMATIHPDGRPQLSLVRPWIHDGIAEITLTASRIKTRNLRADRRAALLALGDADERFVVAEGRAELSAVSTSPGDDTGRKLAHLYRALAGEHPDWDDYLRAMVRDERLIATIDIEHTYTGGTRT